MTTITHLAISSSTHFYLREILYLRHSFDIIFLYCWAYLWLEQNSLNITCFTDNKLNMKTFFPLFISIHMIDILPTFFFYQHNRHSSRISSFLRFKKATAKWKECYHFWSPVYHCQSGGTILAYKGYHSTTWTIIPRGGDTNIHTILAFAVPIVRFSCVPVCVIHKWIVRWPLELRLNQEIT